MLPGKGLLLDSVHKGFQLLKLEAHDIGPCWNKTTSSPALKFFLPARKHRGLDIFNFKLTHNISLKTSLAESVEQHLIPWWYGGMVPSSNILLCGLDNS